MIPDRRQFLSAALLGLTRKTDRPLRGGFVNDAFSTGHRLRDHKPFRRPSQQIRVPLVIVGGGMAGLSAAWQLDRRGFHDFVLLEMESAAGGNARWGQNEVSAYPWAAHYVPFPNRNSKYVRELFDELGLIHDGEPEELHLCFSLQERLYLHGRWQEGIEPYVAASSKDRHQFAEFHKRVEDFKASGEFTIPIDLGAKATALDTQPMTAWLRQNGFDSEYLHWYVDYACRDDYGASAAATSAWAGIHYFASREFDHIGPFTWPEGNGWLVKRLLQKVGGYIRAGSPVFHIQRDGRRFRVLTESAEYITEAIIFAAPTFTAHYLMEGVPKADGFEYSPWLTANLTLDRLPRQSGGVEMAWDNVIYDSPTLGYVVATHQNLSSYTEKTVWTFYWALSGAEPASNRRLLLERDWSHWANLILDDLSRAHPDIRSCVSKIEIMRIGHAMIRPSVGFQFSGQRRRFTEAFMPNLWFANSDLSGISIFEEAQYRGVEAANHALRRLK